jgi:hypothetical protein
MCDKHEKKSMARLHSEILPVDDSDIAKEQQMAVEYFRNNLSATNACDLNELGGISLLVRQMMDAMGKKYTVHEIMFEPMNFRDRKTILQN